MGVAVAVLAVSLTATATPQPRYDPAAVARARGLRRKPQGGGYAPLDDAPPPPAPTPRQLLALLTRERAARGLRPYDLRVLVSLLAVLRYLHRLGRARPARAQIASSMPQLVAGLALLVGCRNLKRDRRPCTWVVTGPAVPAAARTRARRIIEFRAKPNGTGSTYEPTQAGSELSEVMLALHDWGSKWAELKPEHAHPGVVLWAWVTFWLDHDRLPRRRVVVRFDYPTVPGPAPRGWVLIEHGDAEVCLKHPGGEEDLIVVIRDPVAFARWHLGQLDWAAALRSGATEVHASRTMARALPTWNRRGWAPDDPRARFEPPPHPPQPTTAATPA